MGQRIIVKRYAEAFADYSRGTIGLENALEEIRVLKGIMRDAPEFYKALSSPQLTLAEKFDFIDRVCKCGFSQELSQFLKLIVEKQRVPLLFDMLDYLRVNYSHGEAVDAVLKSAYPLDLDVVRKIEEKLEAKFKKRLHFYMELDARIMGGVEVTIGSSVIYGSLKSRLEELGKKIKAARMA